MHETSVEEAPSRAEIASPADGSPNKESTLGTAEEPSSPISLMSEAYLNEVVRANANDIDDLKK